MGDLPETIAGILRTAPDALIVCHVAPDGDCLGASLALALACEQFGVQTVVGSADGVPQAYRDLPTSERIVSVPPPGRRFRVGVAMECGSIERAGVFAQTLRESAALINIDHHLSNAGYGAIVFTETAAAAVGELVLEIIRAMRARITPEIAQALLTAIVTDTGIFRFSSTTARTMRLAADLIEAGGSVAAIVERVYETRSAASLRLLGRALSQLHTSADGRIAWTVITPEMLAEAGALPEETSGIVNMLRQISGVKVALLFEATPAGIRVGLRSRDAARSHVIAEVFGGGGHKAAAGFTAMGPLEDVISRTLGEVEKELALG